MARTSPACAIRLSGSPCGRAAYPTRATRVTCPTCVARASLILERLDERPMHGRLGRPDGGDQRSAENRWYQRRHSGERELVVEPHPGDVFFDDLQQVIQPDGAECEPQHEPERADAERFEPDR